MRAALKLSGLGRSLQPESWKVGACRGAPGMEVPHVQKLGLLWQL
jgi:hypothetical protein